MPRLPTPADTDEFPPDTREAIRHSIAERGDPGRPTASSYLAYAGRSGALLFDLVEDLRQHTSLTGAELELAICTSARATGNDYIWDAHARLGIAAGTRDEALRAVDTHAPLDRLTDDEALIIGFGRELLEGDAVSQPTFDAVRDRYGERGLMELVAVMSVYVMNANILRTMDVEPIPGSRLLTRRPA